MSQNNPQHWMDKQDQVVNAMDNVATEEVAGGNQPHEGLDQDS